MARPPNSYPPTVRTTRVLVDGVAASTLIIPEVVGYRVVVTSLTLGAAAPVSVEFWEGNAGMPEAAKVVGPLPLPDGSTGAQPLDVRRDSGDAFIRTTADLGVTIKPIGAVVVSGVISYYLERAE